MAGHEALSNSFGNHFDPDGRQNGGLDVAPPFLGPSNLPSTIDGAQAANKAIPRNPKLLGRAAGALFGALVLSDCTSEQGPGGEVLLSPDEAKEAVLGQWSEGYFSFGADNFQVKADNLTGPMGQDVVPLAAWDTVEQKTANQQFAFVQANFDPNDPLKTVNFFVRKADTINPARAFLMSTPDTTNRRYLLDQDMNPVGSVSREQVDDGDGTKSDVFFVMMGADHKMRIQPIIKSTVPPTEDSDQVPQTLSDWLLQVGVTPVYAKVEPTRIAPTPTKYASPTPPEPTATPRPEFITPEMLLPDGSFNFAKLEMYPQIDITKDLNRFITECRRLGLFREFSNRAITDLKLLITDHRYTKPNNFHCASFHFDPFTPVPQGQEPFHIAAGAKFSVVEQKNGNYSQENMIALIQQTHVPTAVDDFVTTITVFPDRPEQHDRIQRINARHWYVSLLGLFRPEILSGKQQPNSQTEYDAYVLHQLGLTQPADEVALKMMQQGALLPEVNNKIFMGEMSSTMVQT